MRVRIRKHPIGYWVVESKVFWDYYWYYEQSFHGDDMEKRALQYAQDLINPMIIEVAKRTPS
jgi:hypothetical protein